MRAVKARWAQTTAEERSAGRATCSGISGGFGIGRRSPASWCGHVSRQPVGAVIGGVPPAVSSPPRPEAISPPIPVIVIPRRTAWTPVRALDATAREALERMTDRRGRLGGEQDEEQPMLRSGFSLERSGVLAWPRVDRTVPRARASGQPPQLVRRDLRSRIRHGSGSPPVRVSSASGRGDWAARGDVPDPRGGRHDDRTALACEVARALCKPV